MADCHGHDVLNPDCGTPNELDAKMALRVAARSARQLRCAPVLASTVRGVHSSPSSRGVPPYSISIIDIPN